MNFCTDEEALAQIRGDATADGTWLSIWIPVVSEAIRSWLKDEWRLYVWELDSDGEVVRDSDGNPVPEINSEGEYTVHPLVRGACLLEIASKYRFREGEGDNVVPDSAGYGYILSKDATAILTGLRKSTVA